MATRPFIPVTNVARIELVYEWGGEIVENVLHYKRASWSLADLGLLKEFFVGWFTDSMAPQLSDTLALQRIICTDLTTETAPRLDTTIAPPINGGWTTSPSTPNNTAIVATFRTALRGRSYRGRMFIPGCVQEVQQESYLSPAAVTGLTTIVTSLRRFALGSLFADLVIVSYMSHGAWRTAGVATEVETVGINSRLGTVRRRMPGYGR